MSEHTPHHHTEGEVHESKPRKSADLANFSVPQAILLNGFIIAVAVIVAAFIINHGSFGGTNDAIDKPATAQKAAANVDIRNLKFTADTPYIGNPEAPVTIAYWTDYQCPFCKRFESDTLAQVIEKYVKTGKAKIAFKDLAFLGNDSLTDALYGRAVWNLYPTLYWNWREAMFTAQDGENTGFGDEASVAKLTGSIQGIDLSKVQALIKQRRSEYFKMFDADKQEASAAGLQGTPGLIIRTTAIPGAVPFESVQKILDAALKQQ